MSEDRTANNRTHEPSLRELTIDLDGLKELLISKMESMKEVINERDKLYKERDDSRRTAVDAALAAAKEQTKASFEASEKAIVKAEEAQKSYNIAHNDLARKMDEQNKATMPRTETQQRFDSTAKEISELKTVVAAMVASSTGLAVGGKAVKDEGRANLAIIVAIIGVMLALLSHLIWK